MVPPDNTTETNQNTVIINEQEYTFDLILFNGDISIRIPNSVVHELTLIDNIYAVFTHGHLVLKNDFGTLENFTNEKADILASSYMKKGVVAGDVLFLHIKPKTPPLNDDSLDPAIWGLNYMFSIYDEDELHDPTTSEKLKIFRFKDVREDILDNCRVPWSTADIVAREKNSRFALAQGSNITRSVKTGIAIKDLISSTLVGFKNVFDAGWDSGNNVIFYSTPINQTRFDAIDYILDTHVAQNTLDNCLLRFERNGTWSLLSLESYFRQALKKTERLPGDFTIDIFHIQSEQHTETQEESKIPAKSKLSYDVSLALTDFPGLLNYSFANISNADSNRELVTTPVHSISLGNKQFNIFITDNHIDEAASKFQSMYIDKMHGEPPTHTIPMSLDKQMNFLYNPVSTTNETRLECIKDGRNRVLQKALGLSPGLTFNLEGFTIRRAGRFLSVVNAGSFPETVFQNTIQGEWFITQVVHSFVGNTYRNEVTCIKPYTFKKIA